MQDIRDDLLAKSVRDKIEVLEKEGVIKPDEAVRMIAKEAAESPYPFNSTIIILFILIIVLIVLGFLTKDLGSKDYIIGSIIVIAGIVLIYFGIGTAFNKMRQ